MEGWRHYDRSKRRHFEGREIRGREKGSISLGIFRSKWREKEIFRGYAGERKVGTNLAGIGTVWGVTPSTRLWTILILGGKLQGHPSIIKTQIRLQSGRSNRPFQNSNFNLSNGRLNRSHYMSPEWTQICLFEAVANLMQIVLISL